MGASGGFLFSREKEPKRALVPLYALVVDIACHTVTKRKRVGPSIGMEGPTEFSLLGHKNNLVVLTSLRGKDHPRNCRVTV